MQTALRDCAAVGVLAVCGYFYPVGAAVWLGIILAALFLSTKWRRLDPRERGIAVVLLVGAVVLVVNYVIHQGRDARSFEVPLLGLCACVGFFAADGFAVWFRLRRLKEILAKVPDTAFPFGSLPGELEAASELHRSNVVFYERDRIVGAGTAQPKRTLTTAVDEPKGDERRAKQFKASELLDCIAGHIRKQGAAGDSTAALPQLSVREVLAKPVSEMKKANPVVSDMEIRAAAEKGPAAGAERAYVAARATSWDGELTGTIFVSVALEGRYLRLAVLPYYLAPVVDELRVADQIAGRALATQLIRSLPDGVREIWQVVGSARRRVVAADEKRARRRARTRPEDPPALSVTRSLREVYAKDITEDLHQREDAARILQIMEQRVFTVVETFLDDHGVATARFRAQVDQVINSYITVTGDNNNVAAGTGATAGNSVAGAAPS